MKKHVIALLALALAACSPSPDSSKARDPGPRGGPPGAGEPIAGLTATELAVFNAGKDEFAQAEEVKDGLGPTMNLDGCGGWINCRFRMFCRPRRWQRRIPPVSRSGGCATTAG